MKTRLHGYICVFILLEITQLPIHAKVINGTCRVKREISVSAISQPRDAAEKSARNLEEVNLERGKNDYALLEDDNAYLTEEREISKRSANSSADLQSAKSADDGSSVEKSVDYESAASYRAQRSNEKSDYAEEEAEEETNKEEVARGKRDRDHRETGELVRSRRDVSDTFPDKYTDQDERSSLYDDYEAKEVAKRGILGGPEDYEEAEDDSSAIEDAAALQERESASDEANKRETRSDARVKRDRAISEPLVDKIDLTWNVPKLDELAIAEEEPSSRRASLVESRSSAEASNDVSETKESETNVAVSRPSGPSPEIKEPTGAIAPPADDDLNAEYEKRVEDEIQRKIDSIKEEIRRDIEEKERIRDIEANNAKFDELREHEDEGEQNAEGEPIAKRQTVAKRSVRKEDQAATAFSRRNNDNSSPGKQRNKLRRESREIVDKSNASNKNKGAKKRSVNSGQLSANRLVKRKGERDREMFLVNDDRKARKRRSRDYTSDRTDVRPKSELLADRDLNSYLDTDNKMLPAPDLSVNDNESNNGNENRASAASLVSLTGSSQELSPRLAREYKEAFGGLQSEPGGALARYKRVKRVLSDSDAKI